MVQQRGNVNHHPRAWQSQSQWQWQSRNVQQHTAVEYGVFEPEFFSLFACAQAPEILSSTRTNVMPQSHCNPPNRTISNCDIKVHYWIGTHTFRFLSRDNTVVEVSGFGGEEITLAFVFGKNEAIFQGPQYVTVEEITKTMLRK